MEQVKSTNREADRIEQNNTLPLFANHLQRRWMPSSPKANIALPEWVYNNLEIWKYDREVNDTVTLSLLYRKGYIYINYTSLKVLVTIHTLFVFKDSVGNIKDWQRETSTIFGHFWGPNTLLSSKATWTFLFSSSCFNNLKTKFSWNGLNDKGNMTKYLNINKEIKM